MVTRRLSSVTARTVPVTDHDTPHTAHPKFACPFSSSFVWPHCPGAFSSQMTTVPSCEHEAIKFCGKPMLGHHATSRTQSVCTSGCGRGTVIDGGEGE